jgi:hypothetical protein
MKPKVKTKLEDGKLVAASVGFEEGDTCPDCGITEEEYEDKDRPELPLEVFNDKPVDPEKVWKELVRACRGNG